MSLNKADQKKSKYTMTVLADDKSIEKKDKTAGEPVQFYVKGSSHQAPYEIVVFEVNKNQITGYLSTPTTVDSYHERTREREDPENPPFFLWIAVTSGVKQASVSGFNSRAGAGQLQNTVTL